MDMLNGMNVVMICVINTAGVIVGLLVYFQIRDWLTERREAKRYQRQRGA